MADGNDVEINLWDAETGECLHWLQAHSGIHGSVVSPDGSLLVSGRSDRTLRGWDVATQQCLQRLEGYTGVITSVLFFNLGTEFPILANGNLDETIRLWNVQTSACLAVLRPNRLYEAMNITGISGLSPNEIAILKTLGALEQ